MQARGLSNLVGQSHGKMQEDHTRARDFPASAQAPAPPPPPSRSRDFPASAQAPAPPPPASRSLIANEKVEELIDEVSKRPALYKKDLKQYSDINVKKKLWEEVCEALISNWGELSANERKDLGHEIQKKWNNLRTCFARELKAQKSVKSGQAASKRRPYVYFERMLFLVPCVELRPTEGSIESELSQDDADLSEEAQSNPQRKRKTKQSDFDDQVLKALQSNEDDDTNYCLSLVPFMKELTPDEKLEVRIRILQIFQDTKKKRLLPNTMFNIQPSTSQFSRSSRPPKRATPSTSIRVISDEVIQPQTVQSTRQPIFSQHMTEPQQQYVTGPQETIPSYLQLSSPPPESQTPPLQRLTPSPHDSTISSYWSNFSEQSDSELIDL